MPSVDREDSPGTWHHVMNRAVARRTLFEWREDRDEFLALVQQAVQRGWLEVHAYTLLSTHFHMLVRSPVGELSNALRHIQLGYVRWFNRSRKRDGPLVRGRFRSKPVNSWAYRCVLVGYIDANATRARLAPDAASYPACSAFHYARPTGPPWLCREWIESVVCQDLGLSAYCPERYAEVFCRGFERAHEELVERHVLGSSPPAPTDDLIAGSSEAVLDWMRRKAALADGTAPAVPVVAPHHVEKVMELSRSAHGDWIRRPHGRARDGWAELRALLLRQIAGSRFSEIGEGLGWGEARARRLHRRALTALEEDLVFAERAGEAAKRAFELCYGRHGTRRCPGRRLRQC